MQKAPHVLEEEVCPICLQEFEEGEELVVTFCLHQFHGEHLWLWAQMSPLCPMCKHDLRYPPVDGKSESTKALDLGLELDLSVDGGEGWGEGEGEVGAVGGAADAAFIPVFAASAASAAWGSNVGSAGVAGGVVEEMVV